MRADFEISSKRPAVYMVHILLGAVPAFLGGPPFGPASSETVQFSSSRFRTFLCFCRSLAERTK